MKMLSLEIPDELYAAFEQMAARYGRTIESLAVEWLAKQDARRRPELTPEQRRAARARLHRHFGAVDSGDPHSADNERIDADLARVYGSTHEEE